MKNILVLHSPNLNFARIGISVICILSIAWTALPVAWQRTSAQAPRDKDSLAIEGAGLITSLGPLLTDVTALAAGDDFTCALTTGGGVKCWGYNVYGQLGSITPSYVQSTPVDVSGLTSGIVAIAAGGRHACALTANGGVKCWGYNDYGQLGDGWYGPYGVPVDVSGLTSSVTAITAGAWHTCALTTSGGVKCWGSNRDGQVGNGTISQAYSTPVDVSGLSSGVKAVAAGGHHTCALTANGGVKCWGGNSLGQLGDGTPTYRTTPVDVSGLTSGVKALAAGSYYTCALTTNGGAKCWGANEYGQLGDGTTVTHITPTDAIGLSGGITALTTGWGHTCAQTASGGIKCWGANAYGQLGNGRVEDLTTPEDVSGLTSGITALAAGGLHTCARTASGGVKCWGYNRYGQLGDGTIAWGRSTPTDMSGLTSGVTMLTAGESHTCALANGGGVKCWGENQWGQLGDGTTIQRGVPTDVDELTSGVTILAAKSYHTCVLTASGGVKCWGKNEYGQLGDGTADDRHTPVDVVGLTSGMVALATGSDHTCALTANGKVKCWGENNDGQLGDGSTAQHRTPVDVSGLANGIKVLVAGGSHSCTLTADGGVKCWGNNSWGQLGDGTNLDRSTPVDVSGLISGVIALAAGRDHTCALTSAGGVKCWGYNGYYGQLGDGTTTSRYTPVDVSGLTSGIGALAAGGDHTCALTVSGGVKCWGRFLEGVFGDGTPDAHLTPVDVNGLARGVTAIAAGVWHTCALVGSGRPKCWGADYAGQLGLGTLTQSLMPVDVLSSVSPSLTVNYPDGQPGSFLTLTGDHFAPYGAITIAVNLRSFSEEVIADQTGSFLVFLATTAADQGRYLVTAGVEPSVSAQFILDANAPLRGQEGGGQTLYVLGGLSGIWREIHFPLVTR